MDLQPKPCLAVECFQLWYFPSERNSIPILSNLNMRVPANTIYGLIGPSGCGKTTLQRCIWGYHRPTLGTVRTLGRVPGGKNYHIPGEDVGYMPQDICLDSVLTIRETLVFFGTCYGLDKVSLEQKISELIALIGEEDTTHRIDQLSGGQKRRVSFACALIHEPKLLILDEPTVGSDPMLRKAMWTQLEYLRDRKKTTVIISTHYTDELSNANIVGIMKNGSIVGEENPQSLVQSLNAGNLEDAMVKFWSHLETSKRFISPEAIHRIISNPSHEDASESIGPRTFPLLLRTLKTIFRKTIVQFIFALFIAVSCNSAIVIYFDGIPSDLRIGVLLEDHEKSNPFLEALPADMITLVPYDSYQEAHFELEQYRLQGYFIIHSAFQEEFEHLISCNFKSTLNCLPSDQKLITYIGDPSKRFIFDTLRHTFEKTLEAVTSNFSLQLNRNANLFQSIEFESVFQMNQPDLFWEGKYSTIWRVTIHACFTLPIYLTIPCTINEIKSNIMERLLSLGYTAFQIFTPSLIVLAGFNITFNVLTLLLSITFNDYTINSGLWSPLMFSVTLAFCGTLLGFIICYTTRSEAAALNIYIWHNNAAFFVIGCIWPREALSYYGKVFPYIYPSSFAGDAMIETMVKGMKPDQSKATLFGQQLTLIHCFIYFIVLIMLVRK